LGETDAFINDLKSRLATRIQPATHAFPAYYGAIGRAFENRLDYAQLQKVYASDVNWGRYSRPLMIRAMKDAIIGQPDRDVISTSYVERQNLTMRMAMRGFTRLTDAFSKKTREFESRCRSPFAHYNFVRIHKSPRVTPAMAAGVTDRLWSIEELMKQMPETKLRVDLIRNRKVLTTNTITVRAKGDLEEGVRQTFAKFRGEHPDDTVWEIDVSVRESN
jgi:hypothetical protein